MTNKSSVVVLKETREEDQRVILMPEEVKVFVDEGFIVYVEENAGINLDCPDDKYIKSGASIVTTVEAWNCSDYVIKCRCPSEKEWKYFRPGLNICCTFYAGSKPELVKVLCEKKVNAYSYELFKTSDGIFPLMTTDSEISGHMAVIYGAYHLQNQFGGSGIMLGYMPGVKRPKVLIIGHGNAGGAAARTAASLGADVIVLGTNKERLRKFQATVPSNVRCFINSKEILEQIVPESDLVIGAILISIWNTPPMIDEKLLRKMKKGSVIVDVTCGYGKGYLPTAYKKTRELIEAYKVHNVIHIKNDCIPKLVHRTAVAANSKNVIRYLINLGKSIYDPSFRDPISEEGLIISDGKVVHPQINYELDMMMLNKDYKHL